MKILNNVSVSYVKGFKAYGAHCGIKKNNKKDLAIIYSEVPAVASAIFTTNIVKAAPVLIDMKHVKSNNVQAMVINSGVANACTGDEGYENGINMAKAVASNFDIDPHEVLIYSTGVIGVQLPMDTLIQGINDVSKKLVSDAPDYVAEAIMTTDTVEKSIAVEIELSGKPVTICGMAKGSGMIHPNMATMLSYIFTDANISKDMLDLLHKKSADDTFNMISVDGDTSTNDTATTMANGAAGNDKITSQNDDYNTLAEAIYFVSAELAKMIAKDGEGASKLLEIHLNGAKSVTDAKKCAKAIISSSLVKTAIFGEDANWGRVLCAMGYSGGSFNPDAVDLSFTSSYGVIEVYKKGVPIVFDEDHASKVLSADTIIIKAELNDGDFSAKAWGCDLTYDYVKINGDYRT